MKVVFRYGNISWVTDNVEDAFITRVEVLMALYYSRPWQPGQVPLGKPFWIGNHLVDISKVSGLLWVYEVRNEKSGPRIARLWIRHEEYIAPEYFQISPWMVQSKGELYPCNKTFIHSNSAS